MFQDTLDAPSEFDIFLQTMKGRKDVQINVHPQNETEALFYQLWGQN